MITRLRIRMRFGDDSGFGLVYVMLISVLAMILVGTASTTLVSQIKPTAASTRSGQAVAAAEAGLEDFVAQVNKYCTNVDGFNCPKLVAGWTSDCAPSTAACVGPAHDPTKVAGTAVTGVSGTGTSSYFWWKVIYAVPGAVRVKVYGQVLSGSTTPKYHTSAMVADLKATPSFANFEYYTKYETFPSDFVKSFFAPRTIQITNASGSTLSGPGSLTWQGTCTSSDPNDLNHCTGSGGSTVVDSANICEDLYYPYNGGLGRGTDSAWNNSVRRANANQTALGTDNSFAYYDEAGTFTPTSGAAVNERHSDTCDSSFEPNMVMNGPVYSMDAYLIDRGKCTGSSANSMTHFSDPAYSMYNGVINGVQQAPGPNGGYIRAYPLQSCNGGAQIDTPITPQPVYTTNELNLPPTPLGAKALATCTYTGPTRILLNPPVGGAPSVATVTSPMTNPTTAVGPSYCYTSTGSFTNTGGGGVVNAQVPVNNTVIYVANPDATQYPTHPLATAASPIFSTKTNLTVPTSTSGDNFTAAGLWADNSTYSATASCTTPVPTNTRRVFDCETSKTTPIAADVYTAIKNAVDTEMASSAADTAVQADLTTKIGAAIDKTGVLVTSAPSTLNDKDIKYMVTVSAVSSGTPTTTTPASQGDQFYQSKTGGGYTTTAKTWAVSLTRYSCTSGPCGGKKQTAIATKTLSFGNAMRTTVTPASTVNTTSTWPWFGSTSSYTDTSNDVTRYRQNYGDAYVEGKLYGNLTIATDHDVIVTNNIRYVNSSGAYDDSNMTTTKEGLGLIATHNVRVYRPLTCTVNGTAGATTAGYCPNDLTGVYPQPISWPVDSNYPTNMYTNDVAPSMMVSNGGTGYLDAMIFALRGCFMVDNFYRGTDQGDSLTITGGLYQYHRGPTSLPFQGRPYQGSTTKMPGILLTYNYDDMHSGQDESAGYRIPAGSIPTPSGRPTGSPRPWNVIGVSSASS